MHNHNQIFLAILGNILGTVLTAFISVVDMEFTMKFILFLLGAASYIITIRKQTKNKK